MWVLALQLILLSILIHLSMEQAKQRNITDHLYGVAASNPEKAAFLHPKNLSFGKLILEIDRYAEGFRANGIGQGTRTIVLIKPGIDLFAVTFALFRVGAIPVMIDPGMGLSRMVNALAGVKADAMVGIPQVLMLRTLFPKKLETIQYWFSTGFCWIRKGFSLRKMSYVDQRSEAFYLDSGKEAAIFFTSGSTGPPKGVVYTIKMLEAQIETLKKSFGYGPGEIDLCTFPLVGLLLICMGISIVIADMDMGHPSRLNPGKIIDNILDFRCTHMFASPMVLKRLSAYGLENKVKLDSLNRVMTAGAPVLPSILRDFRELLNEEAEIHTPYGATEALPVADIAHKELLELYKDTNVYLSGICVGYPLEGIHMRIISISDEALFSFKNTRILNENEVGEITLFGSVVSDSYWMNPKANELAKLYDGDSKVWHRTGDLGRIDPQGRLWFYGRKSHRVESGGKIYFTIPVEAVFNQHPEVARAALVGVKKDKMTDKVPVICIERVNNKKRKIYLYKELRSMASEKSITECIQHFIVHPRFPVDPRHNAKIFREKLSEWANLKLKL